MKMCPITHWKMLYLFARYRRLQLHCFISEENRWEYRRAGTGAYLILQEPGAGL